MRRVIIETPYAAPNEGGVSDNIAYARRCMLDSLRRGEAPLASHLLYAQQGVLCDKVPDERRMGIDAGFEWHHVAHALVVYMDRGISSGMQAGIAHASRLGLPIEYRTVSNA